MSALRIFELIAAGREVCERLGDALLGRRCVCGSRVWPRDVAAHDYANDHDYTPETR